MYLNLNPFSEGTHTSSTVDANITPSHPRAYPIASPNSLGLAANLGQGQSWCSTHPLGLGHVHRERRQETLATTFEGFKAVLEHLNPAQKESMATVQLKPKLVAKKWPIHSQPNNLSNLDQNALHVHTDESWSDCFDVGLHVTQKFLQVLCLLGYCYLTDVWLLAVFAMLRERVLPRLEAHERCKLHGPWRRRWIGRFTLVVGSCLIDFDMRKCSIGLKPNIIDQISSSLLVTSRLRFKRSIWTLAS